MSNFNDLIEISGCDNSSRCGDVIFVHGLGGHARGTWHPQEKHDDDNFWPAWLGKDFPDLGIWSLGYEVEPFKWKGNAMPLVDRATNILDLLDSYEIGDRPLISLPTVWGDYWLSRCCGVLGFLQRVGGGYRFMHDLLRQHFAANYW